MSKAMLKKFCLSFKSRILKGHLARVTKTGQFSKPAGTLDHFLRWPLASRVFGANKKWSILWCRDPVSMLSLLFKDVDSGPQFLKRNNAAIYRHIFG